MTGPDQEPEPTVDPGPAPVDNGRMGPLSGFFDGPISFFKFWRMLDRRAWALFISYLCVAGGVVTGVALLLVTLGPDIRDALLEYLFPEHWRMAGKMLFERYLNEIGEQVLAIFILNGGMSAISMTCFAIKEGLSRRIEHTNPLLPFGHEPWPLWRQAVEELKFAVLYLLAYNIIFWVFYFIPEGLRIVPKALSYFVLFTFFNITFLCPLFLRHRIGYGRMVRTFFVRPFAAYGFAAFYLAPGLIAAWLLKGQGHDLSTVVGVLLGIHVFTVAPAAAGGTWVTARLLPKAQSMRPSRWFTRAIGWLVMFAMLGVSGYVWATLAGSINAKTQILKCQYRVDWSTFDYKLPSMSDLTVGLSVDIEIHNPTDVDVLVEDSRLEVENKEKHFATVQIGRIEVPAGETRRERVDLKLEISLGRLLEYKELLVAKDWKFTLWIQVDEDWEFPIYIK